MDFSMGRESAFRLPRGIRPGPLSKVIPAEGYRHGVFKHAGRKVPMLAASVSAERLFEVFCDLLEPLGETVDAYLQRHAGGETAQEMLRESVDLPVLLSQLCDAEELLVDDGATGVVICAKSSEPMAEVHLDDHKALIIYAYNLTPFMMVLDRHGLRRDPGHRLVLEEQHLHLELPDAEEAFDRLASELSMMPVPGKVRHG